MSKENKGYVTADYLREAAQMLADLKQKTYAHLPARPGSRILDVGCGPGIDTIPLAEIVGPSGEVIGVDIDQDMLTQAEELAISRGVMTRSQKPMLQPTRSGGSCPANQASRFSSARNPIALRVSIVALPTWGRRNTLVSER